ncbi:X-linked lymphocyte-regulated protein 3C isoform X1 [Cricetulus griseus]|uniref:Synaptonemal complex protein 3-like n=1 Tax=Cricetulus griseus TaxID=10029 RepID=G3IM54_CRIGR|nr:X-linked lymphocyte-regulated protein 3C isoform X1 [Cricetulus griseus]XP_007605802.1 X-linked lymphocyte-regulated protein 3C isoform X1 [Cricetulus griseus]XP_027290187.1 X-linked lymphocyte-regulated protein 3C-like isoform X1 [Cricetulus griseus]XP_027290188.1 X-linked lymphocyte-regulated protein 3C-like isoform X1 [Cricetulus griseus]XP_027290190.1 X-linked lymphocyte-regulated protein 3C isoform X3 [Cricetulus griseus]XP_027290191.1 X-linked lymphocyte-regulated protein 3C isoform X
MAPKIKSKSPKKSKMTPDLASDDLQQLPENIPPENNRGSIPALETSGENSSSHKTGGAKPGPSKKPLHGRRKRYVLSVSNTIYNVEQRINHFLKLQHERRQEMYKEYSHQFLTLVVMWNIDVDQVKKHAENLSNILEEQQKLFQQFQVIHKEKIEEFKELCNRHLKSLQAIKSCRRKAIIEEARKQMDVLERKLTTETVKLQEEKASVRSSLLSLLFS